MRLLVPFCRIVLCALTAFFLTAGFVWARTQQSPDPHQVPVMDGEAGPCSVGFTVTDDKGVPVCIRFR